MIWNPNKECMSRDEMSALQGKRLHKIVEYVYHNVPFYRHKLQERDLTPDDIRTIEDIVKLPYTTKKDLRDNYPFGLQAAPQSEIIRIHASSGTTGNPTIVGYTRKDIGVWSECMARCLTAFGVGRDDIFSVAYGYGLFTGGLGAHNGVEMVGASVVPASTGNTEKHARLIRDLGITGIACTPSYALYLAETMEQMGITKDQIKLRVGAFGAEPWTEKMREEIEERLGLKGFNIYGLSEVMGPSVSYECPAQHGSHINEDHFYPEIINPVTLEPLPKGQSGELVFTTLTKEGMPVIRYRTRDLCSLMPGECSCGRTSVRMTPIAGRSDDMLIIRGINVFPSQVESVVLSMKEFAPRYLLVVDRINNLDTLEVQVELRQEYFTATFDTGQERPRHRQTQTAIITHRNMTVNQLSIFLENRAGTLTKVLDLFKEAHIRIIASSIADTAQYGLLRIICVDPQRAYVELERAGVAVAFSDVFAVELDERPGQIAGVVRGLSEAEIGIVYMYSLFIHGKGLLFIRTDKTEEARDVIQRSSLRCVPEKELPEWVDL